VKRKFELREMKIELREIEMELREKKMSCDPLNPQTHRKSCYKVYTDFREYFVNFLT